MWLSKSAGAKVSTISNRLIRRVAFAIALLGAIVLLESTGVHAMPPHPRLAAKIASGEIKVPETNRRLDERSTRGLKIPTNTAAAALAAGTFNTLAILIQYSDETAIVHPSDYDTLLYGLNHGSVRDFYRDNSLDGLDIVTVNLPSSTSWQSVPQTAAYYANGEYGLQGASYPNNAQKLVEDALAAADPLVDFSDYDNDSDGWLDALMIIHTGPGAEFTGDVNDIWSHKWGITPQTRDGILISTYAMMPEYWSSPGDITIGVFAHEMGHYFGLPDLYDTDNSSRGLGRWCLMAGGGWNGFLGDSPAHLSAWCKVQLGFVVPTLIELAESTYVIPAVETSGIIYRVSTPNTLGSEYFLLENRQQNGFDGGLPAEGLLVWHIDDALIGNQNEWYPGNTGSGHLRVALEQADGDWDLERNFNSGDSGDPFPGSSENSSFGIGTVPNSRLYSGTNSSLSISEVSNSGEIMTFRIQTAKECQLIVGGDVDDSGKLNMSDILYMINYTYRSGPEPIPCAEVGDVNCTGSVNSTDIIYAVYHIFRSGPPPCDVCTIIASGGDCP